MHSCDNICVHTDDKNYSNEGQFHEAQFSAINIGTHKLSSNKNALNGKTWDENETIYWQLDSDYEWLSHDILVDIMKDAFLETSLTTKTLIKQKRKQTGDAHIKVRWIGGKDEKYFRDKQTVLAFAYGPQTGIGGDMTFNADKIWRLPSQGKLTVSDAYDLGMINGYDTNHPNNTLRTYDPYHTAKHEGGHATGMKHITDINQKYTSIMYPYYNGKRMWGEADLDYLFTLYTKIGSWERAIRIAKRKMGFD